MSKNNNLKLVGLGMILVTALALAGTAAYQSIIGLADLFAARYEVVIIMAIFIEWAKLLFAGALHMFWRNIPWWKWIGVGVVCIHMAVTNIGIYAYLSSGYLLQEAPVAALERQIETLDRGIASYQRVEEEAAERISAMDLAYRKYVDELYIRRAEEYKQRNAIERAQLEQSRDSARAERAKLETDRDRLQEQKVDNAAKLGSIEHISAFVGSESDDVLKVVAAFTILLMMGLDPAAVLMVVLFTFLLSKKMRDDAERDAQPPNPIEELDDDTKAAVEHLNEIGYLDRRKKKS